MATKTQCPTCKGRGSRNWVLGNLPCGQCRGTGKIDPSQPQDFVSQVRRALAPKQSRMPVGCGHLPRRHAEKLAAFLAGMYGGQLAFEAEPSTLRRRPSDKDWVVWVVVPDGLRALVPFRDIEVLAVAYRAGALGETTGHISPKYGL